MGVSPIYYRQADEIYPNNAIILTEMGTFPLEIEHYLGQTGADSVHILNRNHPLKNVYAPFVRYYKKHEFVDYSKPKILAFHQTFLLPAFLGKKNLKTSKKTNQIAPFISFIGGIIIFSSCYAIIRDCKIISNSVRLIQKSKNIQKFIAESKEENPEVIDDPIYQSLNKVTQLREKIYKRNLISGIVSVAMTTALVASSIIAIIAAIAGSHFVLIGAAAVGCSLLLGHSIKSIIEWKGRLDKQPSKEILDLTEGLRFTLPPHLL